MTLKDDIRQLGDKLIFVSLRKASKSPFPAYRNLTESVRLSRPKNGACNVQQHVDTLMTINHVAAMPHQVSHSKTLKVQLKLPSVY